MICKAAKQTTGRLCSFQIKVVLSALHPIQGLGVLNPSQLVGNWNLNRHAHINAGGLKLKNPRD